MAKLEYLIGKRFGKLTVIARADNQGTKAMWVCLCDCGKIKEKAVTSYDLKSGKIRSCGCLYLESNKGRNKTHGLTNTRIHRVWSSMKARCSSPAYKNYFGRGITVCNEWVTSFENFYVWATANGYSDELTIDRIDTNGNYCPENCRWVSMKQQQNNRRNNRMVTYFGVVYTLSELADFLHLSNAALAWRINHGWKESDFALPVNLNNRNIRRGYQ